MSELKNPNPIKGGNFGFSVAAPGIGPIGPDSLFVVGSPNAIQFPQTHLTQGCAYIFNVRGEVIPNGILVSPNPQGSTGDPFYRNFGRSVARSTPFPNPRPNDSPIVVVGAPLIRGVALTRVLPTFST